MLKGCPLGRGTSPNLRLLEGERATIDLTDGAGHRRGAPGAAVPGTDPAAGPPRRWTRRCGCSATCSTPRHWSPPSCSPASCQNAAISLRVVLLFVVGGHAMLWPTHRRGRLVIGPTEGLARSSAAWAWPRWSPRASSRSPASVTLSNAGRFIDVRRHRADRRRSPCRSMLLGPPHQLPPRPALARRRGYDLEDTLIVGTGPVGVEVADALHRQPRVRPGAVRVRRPLRRRDRTLPLVGRPEHLPEILARTGVRHVVLAFGAAGEEELVGIIRRCHDTQVQFYAVPRLFELGGQPRGRRPRGRRPAAGPGPPPRGVLQHVAGQAGLRRRRLLAPAACSPSPILLACAAGGEADQPRSRCSSGRCASASAAARSRSSSSAP